MNIFFRIDLPLYSFLLLTSLLIYYKLNAPKEDYSTKLFTAVLITLMANNFFDALSWVQNGVDSPLATQINYWVNVVNTSINLIPLISWTVYFDYQIFKNKYKLKRRFWLYCIPLYITIIMMIVNHFTGWVFTIETGNLYTRHIGIYIIGGLMYAYGLVVFILTRKYKSYISGDVLQTIIWFLLLPVAGGLLQLLFFGTSLTWPLLAFATFMAFILIEKDHLSKDLLTKLCTRRQLEHRIKYLLKKGKHFSLIMIDLDGFKIINDLYGHEEGDKTLQTIAAILERSVKRSDMVCRYGGDEFMILVESEKEEAGKIVYNRIEARLARFNQKKTKPYSINMSFGVFFYDGSKDFNLKSILSHVDELMYKNKNKIKRQAIATS